MFVFLRKDSIDQGARAHGEHVRSDVLVELEAPVRRPYRGIQIKKDTYASISIISADSETIPMVSESAIHHDESTGFVYNYSDFILQGVEDAREEKVQVMDTFGDPYVYFYGEKPRFATFSGILMNTEDFNWRAQFWHNYETYLRGTKLAQRGARAYIAYDSIVVEGYPINARASENADTTYMVNFQLTMLVTNYFDYTNVGEVKFPGWDKAAKADASILNAELAKNRQKFVSTTEEVRFKNLMATSSPSNLLGKIGKGVNNIKSAIGGVMNAASTLIGGRSIRVPIGVAGYFAMVGKAKYATGSVDGFSSLVWDAQSGKYMTATGRLTMNMPVLATYCNPILLRGFKSDNLDEYPTRAMPESPLDLLSVSDRLWFENRAAARVALAAKNDAILAAWNTRAQMGNVFTNTAKWVNGIKTGFSLLATGRNLVKSAAADPAWFFKESLQLGYVYDTLGPSNYGMLYKSVTGRNLFQDVKSYVGQNAQDNVAASFTASVSQVVSEADPWTGEPEEKGVGEVYEAAPYTSDSTDDKSYENVYEDTEYTDTDSSTQQTIDEVYGSSDDAEAGSDIQQSELVEAYSTGVSASQAKSPEEILHILIAAQRGEQQNSEDTRGIRGREDSTTVIEPVR